MKKIFLVVKRVSLALCMLYTFNLIISSTGTMVPINVTSIGIVSILGMPSVIALFFLAKYF